MKRWIFPLLVFSGVAVLVVSIWLGTTEGIAVDAEGRGGDVLLFVVGAGVGLIASVVGLIGVLTAVTERRTGAGTEFLRRT